MQGAPATSGVAPEHHAFLWDFLRQRPHRFPSEEALRQVTISLIEIADKQGVDRLLMEWLWRHMDAFEPGLREQLRKHKLYVLGQALTMEAALAECLGALEDAGVPSIPIKGVSLAHRMYDEVALRPTSDTDILIHRHHYDAAINALAKLGYVPDDSPMERYFLEKRHNAHLRAPDRPILELHFRLFVGFGTELETETVWGEPHWAELPGGREFRCMEPEVELTYLALHCATHVFNRWIWIYDLKLFALRHPDLDWERVEKLADTWGVTDPVRTALHYAREMGAPVPNRLGGHQVRRLLVEWALGVGLSGRGGVHTVARLAALGMLCSGAERRLRWAKMVAEEVGIKRGLLG